MYTTTNHQTANREEWLLDRHGLITGTRASALTLETYAPKATKTLTAKWSKALDLATENPDDEKLKAEAEALAEQLAEAERQNRRLKVPKDFWGLVGERLGDPITDGLSPMQRGTLLESENIAATVKALGIDPATVENDPAMWVDEKLPLGVSPDAHEKTERPTWAIECKSLGFAEHIKAFAAYAFAHSWLKIEDEDTLWPVCHEALTDNGPLAGVPDQYRAQVLQYFVVNPDLETLYFSLYLPELGPTLGHLVLALMREDLDGLILAQREALESSAAWVERVARVLGKVERVD